MTNKYLLLLLALFLQGIYLSAQVEMPPLFSDNMVLQQQSEVPIWGKSQPNKNIKIITSWDKKEYNVTANQAGNWSAKLQTIKAGGPYIITVLDGKATTLNNVMLGEVWLCSGQSNMEMPVDGWGKVNNYQQELLDADKYPNIRLLQVEKTISTVPVSDLKVSGNGWQVCNAKTLADFSSVAYFFGRDINKYQNVPIGLINSSWGGTIAETWTSGESLETMPDFAESVQQIRSFPTDKSKQGLFYEKQLQEWKKSVDKKDYGIKNENPFWAALSTDDSDWKEMKVPGFMQDQGLLGFNGIVWFRKVIEIPQSWSGKELTLHLGAIDDNDFTYFNGVEIGYTEGWMSDRTYKIPANLVKGGKAVITVRVIDTGGSGGIYGSPENVYIQESPTNKQNLSGNWKYKVSLNVNELPPVPADIRENPNSVTLLYNAMINPIVPYTIKGAIWYQGEANTGRAYQYRDLLPLMITDWRNKWKSDFDFYIVQLANFTKLQTTPVESTWAELREAQARTLHLKNTGMAVTIDIGEADDIHPKNKQDVGKRLALAARVQTYGENISYSGPVMDTYKIEGNKIRIYFKHTEGGLKTLTNDAVKGFTIAGLDHKFHWADAVIDGNTIVISCSEVSFPVAVRYAWADNPICNLYNGDGLPASPFRTDDWPGATANFKK